MDESCLGVCVRLHDIGDGEQVEVVAFTGCFFDGLVEATPGAQRVLDGPVGPVLWGSPQFVGVAF